MPIKPVKGSLIKAGKQEDLTELMMDRISKGIERTHAKWSTYFVTMVPDENYLDAASRTTRVIGWYHSHPHITVLPSHVDVRTQAMYQLLDSGFIGLIFSCFSEDTNKVGRIQVIAFQSLLYHH
ncbi:hypothetical protein ES332_A10G168100v1 [Gossypium tomentosum]|uniref:MPN domain-containing protein n=1 Tax=Gossypium tomentosum TaxID=34277 RepID=A0A5D2NW60_GOSTO|nr:hypothetical protein ES332_A10G168100v1 [Gossypium tomentosum]